MKQDTPPRIGINTVVVFVGTLVFLYWTTAQRFVLSYDEGIYLDGSRRILDGQAPYRDFFILMGPGSFWLQALALKLFGMTLAASRAIVLLDLSVIAACLYQLVARQAGSALGVFVAALCIVLETAEPVVGLPNHRWDSAALAILAITILSVGARGAWIYLAGAAAAFSAWSTPTVGLVLITLAGWLAVRDRANLWRFSAGAVGVTVAAAGALAAQGAVIPMLQQMFWTGSHYGRANWVPYGGGLGGYLDLFKDIHGVELLARGVIVMGIALPAILPPVAVLLVWRTRTWGIACLGAVALLATAYPRFDLPHLTYVAPLFFALAAISLASFTSAKIKIPAFLAASLLLTLFAAYTMMRRLSEAELQSNVGVVRASGDDLKLVRQLQQHIPRGSELFVYPYLPIAYFFTLGHNPTRYSYLQPGMMSDQDEAAALRELQAAPPERVVYYDMSEAQILKLWPNSDPARLRLRKMEDYLATHYRAKEHIAYRGSDVQVMERLTSAELAQHFEQHETR